MNRIYRVRLHERSYAGSTNEMQVADLAVRAATLEQACRKAMAYINKGDWSPCRVTDCVEMTDIYEVIP
jgi:hypothetical protein